MAFSLSHLANPKIAVVVGSGTGSLEESQAILTALETQTLEAPPEAVLLDVRRLSYVPTAEEARQIATAYGLFGARHRCRMAYVAPPGAQYGIARMVQMISESHGAMAEVFSTQEAALTWLRQGRS
jgi:hypothetical protein